MVSARGFGLGYIGSTIPFLLSIAVILSAQAEVIPLSAQAAALPFDYGGMVGLFSIPLLLRVRQRYYIEREPRLVLSSFKRLAR